MAIERTNQLNNLTNNSLSSSGIHTEFLQSSMPRASIYRLKVQMGDCFDKYGRRLDGGHEPFRETAVQPKFWDFRWKSFMFESRVRTVRHCHPDSRMSVASNFFTKASRVRTMGKGCPDSWSSTRNFHICWTRMQTMADWHPGGWVSGRGDTSSRRLAVNQFLWFANSAKSFETLLNSGIPVEKHICI